MNSDKISELKQVKVESKVSSIETFIALVNTIKCDNLCPLIEAV